MSEVQVSLFPVDPSIPSPSVPASTVTPALKQYWEAKAHYPDALLFFRLGDFYELFFDDAVLAAPLLGITLTSRPMGKTERHPMCGIPHHAWQSYALKLIKAGYKVALCEQTSPAGHGLVSRKVTRVLTAGTVYEDLYLSPTDPNHLIAVHTVGDTTGLAVCELSCGSLQLYEIPTSRLSSELSRLNPSETLSFPQIESYKFDSLRGTRLLSEIFKIAHPSAIGAADMPLALACCGVLLDYLRNNAVPLSKGSLKVSTYSPDSSMALDASTIRNLELEKLYKYINSTLTPMGARTLRTWLYAPLCDLSELKMRQEAITELKSKLALQSILKSYGDLERLSNRAAMGYATPRELLTLSRGLAQIPLLKEALIQSNSAYLSNLASMLHSFPQIVDHFSRALIEDPAPGRNPAVIKPNYDEALDKIRLLSQEARSWIASLEVVEKARTRIKNLKVGYNRVFGYYIEVSAGQASQVPVDYIRKQTTTNSERYITSELKDKEIIVLNADKDISAREAEILTDLALLISDNLGSILETARSLGCIDALYSMSQNLQAKSWVMPQLFADYRLKIAGGRHPLVEASLPPGAFTPNDISLDPISQQIMILTGPNMAGKSTYLRQIALITLLAQIGSGVPAVSAEIGLTDRIFTRIGAHDDIAAGLSTFMVEMTEVGNILANATSASLLILDEVGRGTSTYDGLAIAQGLIEHLHSQDFRPRTLFATHYQELTLLPSSLPRVFNMQVEVAENNSDIIFRHHVIPGGADRSYGIHVASLAGLPTSLLVRSQELLEKLEAEPSNKKAALPPKKEHPVSSVLVSEIAKLSPETLTPLQALQYVFEARDRARLELERNK